MASRNNYDLEDDAEDMRRWPQLQAPLLALRETLMPVYLKADQAAIRQQRRHSLLVWWAAICGTLAVLCAIFELSDNLPLNPRLIGAVEVIAAAVAIIVVASGIRSAYHPSWLLNRFLAEQCRFLKFHLLLDPSAWYGLTDVQSRSTIDRLMGPLHSPSKHLIHDWVTWKHLIAGRFSAVPPQLPEEVLKEVISYYAEKRLCEQQRYFDRQAKKRHWWERLTRNVSPCCFFFSIVAAFTHFVFEGLAGDEHHGWMYVMARYSMLSAAALPALAAGVRTIRAAHEFGRNKLRFDGMSRYLIIILEDISKPSTSIEKLQLLREAEIAMDAEHRAWLRLMIEAEWFG